MSARRNLWRRVERINPTVWLFIIGFFLFLLGASFTALGMLKLVGGFIVLVYLIVWIVWVIAHAS